MKGRILVLIIILLTVFNLATPAYTLQENSTRDYNRDNYNAMIYYIDEPLPFDPRSYGYIVMEKTDANRNGIDDGLEQIDGRVGVIVWFNSYTAAESDMQELARQLSLAVSIAEALGGKVYAGPWLYALPGFAVEIDASKLQTLANRLMGLDIDKDGLSDRVHITRDGKVVAYNLWGTRQLTVRPYVWEDLGYTGKGVTVAVVDSGVDGRNQAVLGKIVYWRDYVGDANGIRHNTPYDDYLHGTFTAGSIAGKFDSRDPQGRLVYTLGISDLYIPEPYADLWVTFSIPAFAYMVNSTGTIEIEIMWKSDPDGAISGVALGYCGMTLYPECLPQLVSYINTSMPNVWYTLRYNVFSESQYGLYVLFIQGVNNIALLPVFHFPTADPGDGMPLMAGVAPDAMLAAAKVMDFAGTGIESMVIAAMDDLVQARRQVTPNIYVMNLGLGGAYSPALDQAVTNVVHSGIILVTAAGNNGAISNFAGTGSPSSNPFVISVAAVDGFNNITDYSSKGGPSTSDPEVVKPDLSAPGGGSYVLMLSADTTWHDDIMNYRVTPTGNIEEDIDWSDVVNRATRGYDDSIPIQGTSVSTAYVSGVAALVVEALLDSGFTWKWTNPETVLLVKNILLMSTYETYPLTRVGVSTESPSLDRGGKDPHEGYGALDASAAVNIAKSLNPDNALVPGSVVEYSFRHGILYNSDLTTKWRWPFGKSVWGSAVLLPYSTFKLNNGSVFQSTYSIAIRPKTGQLPSMDLDLYVYRVFGDNYGEPIILAKSTGPGAQEALTITPSNPGMAIIVVKRATEASPGGKWVLSVGPGINIKGQNPDGQWIPGQIWEGYPVEVSILSPLNAPKAQLEVYDNTTGKTLFRKTVTLSNAVGGTRATVTVDLPRGIGGHQIAFIVKTIDNNGKLLSGPFVLTVQAIEVAQEIPQVEPQIDVKPSITPPIDIFVQAKGLQPGVDAEVYLIYPNGNIERLAILPVSLTGETQGIVGLPRSLRNGIYTIAIYQEDTKIIDTTIRVVTPGLTVNKINVASGEQIRLTVTNLGLGYSPIYHVKIGGILVGTIVPDKNGIGEAVITVPYLPNGQYNLEIVYPGEPVDTERVTYSGPVVVASTVINVRNNLATIDMIEQLSRNIETRIKNLEQSITVINKTIDNINIKIINIYTDLDKMNQELISINNRIRLLNMTFVESINDIYNKIYKLENTINNIEGRLAQLNLEIVALQSSIDDINNTVMLLQNDVAELRVDMDDIKMRIDNLTKTIEMLQNKVNTLTLELDKLRQALEELREMHASDMSELRNVIDEILATVTGLEERLNQHSSTLEALKETLNDLSTKIDILGKRADVLEARTNEIEGNLSTSRNIAITGLVLALIGLALGGLSITRKI